jgi:hypothetical protein
MMGLGYFGLENGLIRRQRPVKPQGKKCIIKAKIRIMPEPVADRAYGEDQQGADWDDGDGGVDPGSSRYAPTGDVAVLFEP